MASAPTERTWLPTMEVYTAIWHLVPSTPRLQTSSSKSRRRRLNREPHGGEGLANVGGEEGAVEGVLVVVPHWWVFSLYCDSNTKRLKLE